MLSASASRGGSSGVFHPCPLRGECCVRLGPRVDPASHSPLLAALQSVAVTGRPDCLSEVRLKRKLGCIYSHSRQDCSAGLLCTHGFYLVVQGTGLVCSFSLAQLH